MINLSLSKKEYFVKDLIIDDEYGVIDSKATIQEAAKKMKEIGVRKILGAKESAVIITLGSGILKWVLLANLLAWPITYWLMQHWLHNFSEYISLSPAYFLSAGFIALVIACLTVAYKLVIVSRQNPIEALKYE